MTAMMASSAVAALRDRITPVSFQCPHCKGHGVIPYTCGDCGGQGCGHCRWDGQRYDECNNCDGEGTLDGFDACARHALDLTQRNGWLLHGDKDKALYVFCDYEEAVTKYNADDKTWYRAELPTDQRYTAFADWDGVDTAAEKFLGNV